MTAPASTTPASTPAVIARYLETSSGSDFDALAACFAEDAVVHDDGATMNGRTAIRAWREALAGGFAYTVEVLRTELAADGRHLVTAKVEGDFPGSPVELRYLFAVQDDLITELDIAP